MISSVSGGVNSRSCMKRAGNKRAESGALPDREDSDRETWSFRPSFVPWQKTQLNYFSICPIVQDQTREPNEEPEDLRKLKFCLCYSRITMLQVPGNLNIKTSYSWFALSRNKKIIRKPFTV